MSAFGHISLQFLLQLMKISWCLPFPSSQDMLAVYLAYAWMKWERQEDKSCYEILKTAHINGCQGSVYSAEDRYMRLSLTRSQDDFEILINYLRKLVAEEQGPQKM